MFTLHFWKHTIERAVKTAAQSVVLVWGGGDALLDWIEVDLSRGISVAVGGAVLSVLTSLASGHVNEPGDPSVLKTEG